MQKKRLLLFITALQAVNLSAQDCAKQHLVNAKIAEESRQPTAAIAHYEKALACPDIVDSDKVSWLEAVQKNYAIYFEKVEKEQHERQMELVGTLQKYKKIGQELRRVKRLVPPLLELSKLPKHRSGWYLWEADEGQQYLINEKAELLRFENSLDELDEETQVLDLTNLEGSDFDKISENAPNLKWLYLCDNKLKTIELDLSLLVNLERLDLSGNTLEQIPSSLFSLPQLKYLNLEKNALSSLTGDWRGLQSLQFLNINQNKTTSLPASFKQLVRLETFFAQTNDWIELPEVLYNLESLKTLDLSTNPLEKFKIKEGQFPFLQTLILQDTRLKKREIKAIVKAIPHCTLITK
jgi:hypothetical protein